MLPMHYPFEVIPLSYSYNALEPYIDSKTVEIHHNKHYKTYVDNLNNILALYPQYHLWTLKKLITCIYELPKEIQISVRNNAGGVFNHSLYFKIMGNNQNTSPNETLLCHINNSFCSFEKFKDEFKNAALTQFGSGYAWLVINTYGELCIVKTNNQDTPLIKNVCPLFLIDVWEHSYYLKYQNRRAEYIDNWFNVINWDIVNEKFNTFKYRLW